MRDSIAGVIVKELETHGDPRGFFREIIRQTDPFFTTGFGQLSHSLVGPQVLKAWHAHKWQTQWTYVASGLLKIAIHDCRPDSPTYRKTMELLSGEVPKPFVYVMPPGVAHGYRCLQGPAHVFYMTSGTYDPEDEVRIPHDDPAIGYDWTSVILAK
jgi:dTDP-4-dehydrorhamnose 3,5-epimerase